MDIRIPTRHRIVEYRHTNLRPRSLLVFACAEDGIASGHAFFSPREDSQSPIHFIEQIPYDETGTKPHSWRWPPIIGQEYSRQPPEQRAPQQTAQHESKASDHHEGERLEGPHEEDGTPPKPQG